MDGSSGAHHSTAEAATAVAQLRSRSVVDVCVTGRKEKIRTKKRNKKRNRKKNNKTDIVDRAPRYTH